MAKINFFVGLLIITTIFGTIFGVGQQTLRQGANDPQIQLVEDFAANPKSQIPNPNNFDIASSLSPFVVIYDNNGQPISGNGLLDNQRPTLPNGVLNYVRTKNEDRITWQPKPNLRFAIVVSKSADGFVMAGRSLREVEVREQRLMEMVGLAWIVTMAVFSLAQLVARISKRK